eukprot:12439487-Alexandrium_andersonii.AAC.1
MRNVWYAIGRRARVLRVELQHLHTVALDASGWAPLSVACKLQASAVHKLAQAADSKARSEKRAALASRI